MKVLVVGTGNIGTLYGWALSAAGHEVTHLVRHGSAARPPAAELDILDERTGSAVRRFERYEWRTTHTAVEADVVLVATPASSVRDAIRSLAPDLPDATFMTWAMEWDPVPLDDLIPLDHLVLGYPDSGGTRDDATARYVLSLGREPHLGVRAGSTTSERLDAVDLLLRDAGFAPVRHDPFEAWIQVHAAMTVPYWMALDQVGDIGRFMRDRRRLRSAFLASREVLRLCAARGVDVDASEEAATARVPSWLFPFAFRLLYRTNEGMRRAAAHGLDGIGEGVELARQLLRTADELAVPVPVLRSIAEPGIARRLGAGTGDAKSARQPHAVGRTLG